MNYMVIIINLFLIYRNKKLEYPKLKYIKTLINNLQIKKMGICESNSKKSANPILQTINEDNAIVNAYKIKGIMFSEIEKWFAK